jgi:undecaprenyl diphosphate synthase
VEAGKRLAEKVISGELNSDDINADLVDAHLSTAGMPDPDLMIRTGGDHRISNFMLWQSAYAEMVFLDVLWPDVDRRTLWNAIEIYAKRDRRFGSAK